jgi:hemerythrin
MAPQRQTFCWSEKYSVNIALLDRQHQALFGTINELKDALSNADGAVVVREILKKLIQFALTHFASEEALMTEHDYPGLETHRTEQKRFVQSMEKFLDDDKAGKTGVPVALMLFLQSWLEDHLLKTDKAYSAYLNARGVR